MTNKAPKQATDADRTIGSRVAALRTAQGLSQSTLGDAIGVSFQQIQKYEKGLNRIGAGRLQSIADLLKVPVWTFFGSDREVETDINNWHALFEDSQVVELLEAFRRLPDDTIRKTVLSFVKAAAQIRLGDAAQGHANSV